MLARRLRALLGLVAAVVVLAAPAAASAQTPTPPGEAYPPAAVVNLLDPFGCAPSAISGNIGEVQIGSTVTLQLFRADGSEVLATVTTTPGADGHALYSIPVPPNRFGPVVIRATGTNTVGQPFTIETSGTIVACPASLPSTGSSGIGGLLRGGAAAVVAGVVLVVAVTRRRRHADELNATDDPRVKREIRPPASALPLTRSLYPFPESAHCSQTPRGDRALADAGDADHAVIEVRLDSGLGGAAEPAGRSR